MKTRIKIVKKNSGDVIYYPQYKVCLWHLIIPLYGQILFVIFIFYKSFYLGISDFWDDDYKCYSLESAKEIIDTYIYDKTHKKQIRLENKQAKLAAKTKSVTYLKYP